MSYHFQRSPRRSATIDRIGLVLLAVLFIPLTMLAIANAPVTHLVDDILEIARWSLTIAGVVWLFLRCIYSIITGRLL